MINHFQFSCRSSYLLSPVSRPVSSLPRQVDPRRFRRKTCCGISILKFCFSLFHLALFNFTDMSSSPVRSPPHLQRTNTYPGDAACLAQTFVKHEKKLPAKERSRLAWLGVVAGVVDHAFSNDWSELRYAKDIEQMMRKWTNELDNKSSASIVRYFTLNISLKSYSSYLSSLSPTGLTQRNWATYDLCSIATSISTCLFSVKRVRTMARTTPNSTKPN